MNVTDLEQHLRSLRPAAPAPRLEQRIARDLVSGVHAPATSAASVSAAGVLRQVHRRASSARWLRDLGWAATGALATWTVLTLLAPEVRAPAPPAPEMETASATAPTDSFEHAAATEELLATEDAAELIETEEGIVRPVRYSYRERHAWANPFTGTRVEIEVPREEVYLVPVALQ